MKRGSFPALVAAAPEAMLPWLLPSQTFGQSASAWPAKTVRIVTPFPSGAGPEVVARVLAEKLSKVWGSQVIIDNRPGGNGSIAITAFKQGDKNGYDLVQSDNVHLTAYPHLFRNLPYDPKADFELLLPLFKASFFFVVPLRGVYTDEGAVRRSHLRRVGALRRRHQESERQFRLKSCKSHRRPT
jgi:tripartite-type tricarboxylate transporter receptor subunit TctC